ncbi:MAG: divalent-cation tolerance protein CutA [Desulfobulbaceae bacterium]|nr:divalent-cation tolerance protein CutA [Desulfobulbaceae bacterium]
MTTYIQVVTTLNDKKTAAEIAGALLEKKLVACVQILPCQSMYRWQGKIEESEEYFCIMKSSSRLYPKLEKAIRESHPYDVPEILAVEVVAGNREYLDWLDQELLFIPPEYKA